MSRILPRYSLPFFATRFLSLKRRRGPSQRRREFQCRTTDGLVFRCCTPRQWVCCGLEGFQCQDRGTSQNAHHSNHHRRVLVHKRGPIEPGSKPAAAVASASLTSCSSAPSHSSATNASGVKTTRQRRVFEPINTNRACGQ